MTQSPSPSPAQPGARLRRILSAEPREPDLAMPGLPGGRRRGGWIGPAYWTITGTLSLIVNVILLIVLLSVWPLVRQVRAAELVGSLYSNFYRMEQSVIRTEVPVRTQIPIDFTLRVNVETVAVLSHDVSFTNVPIIINTTNLDINAPASFTLPAGTRLPIILDMSVPVKATQSLNLTIPVQIPIASTELAQPFQNLRQAFQPLYCLLKAGRFYPELPSVCE